MIVTVAGSIASGKSTLAANLARKLGFKHVSAGQIMRDMANEVGVSLIEYSKYAEEHPLVDKEIDERQKKLASEGDCVVDGRISAYFIDADFKVYLTARDEVLAKRLAGRERTKNPLSEIMARRESERKRYKEFYGIDVSDLSVYDLVLDTSDLSIQQVLDSVYSQVEKLGH